MARPDQSLQIDRAIKQVDTLLPPHAHHGGPRERFWTTRDGQYRVTFHEADSPAAVSVSFGAVLTGWHVTVPRTGAGIDALTVCMVLAGAINAPAATMAVKAEGTRVGFSDGPDTTVMPGADAFTFGVALVEQSGRTGRY